MTAPLVFTLRAAPEQRLDLSKLAPDRLLGLSEAQIAAIPIGTTKQGATVGDVFSIAVGDPHVTRFIGGSERFDQLGARLLPGFTIEVEGDVGAQLGRAAKGGRIVVSGNAGPYAASQNAGAFIEVKGSAGDFLCGPLAGEMEGMSGGRIIVRGDAGQRAGDRLRRGVVVIEGRCGDGLGSRLIAGTIVALGEAAGRVGYLNKRGSIVLGAPRSLGPTYVDCGVQALTFAKVYARALAKDSPAAAAVLSGKLRRFAGDTAVYGKGEILTSV